MASYTKNLKTVVAINDNVGSRSNQYIKSLSAWMLRVEELKFQVYAHNIFIFTSPSGSNNGHIVC